MKRAWLGLGFAVALAGSLQTAQAADAPKAQPGRSCFFVSSWENWRAPNARTIYLRVNVNDIYRIDLASDSPRLLWPDVHLINDVRGSNSICSAIDLDLKVADSGAGGGFAEPLFVKSLVKLTPEQAAAIPKKDRP